jgi:hypothetical protein
MLMIGIHHHGHTGFRLGFEKFLQRGKTGQARFGGEFAHTHRAGRNKAGDAVSECCDVALKAFGHATGSDQGNMERGWREGGHAEKIDGEIQGGEQEFAAFSYAILRHGEGACRGRNFFEIPLRGRFPVAEIGPIFESE